MKCLTREGIRSTYSDIRTDNANMQRARIKWVCEGFVRILGVITISKRLAWTRYKFTARTAEVCPLMARLFHIAPEQIHVESIGTPDQSERKSNPSGK
jgi:hypothetical protein